MKSRGSYYGAEGDTWKLVIRNKSIVKIEVIRHDHTYWKEITHSRVDSAPK